MICNGPRITVAVEEDQNENTVISNKQMEAVLANQYHGDKLDQMLIDWAKTGM